MPLPALLCLCAAAFSSSFTSRGDYRLAGLFQMHNSAPRAAARPLVDDCDK